MALSLVSSNSALNTAQLTVPTGGGNDPVAGDLIVYGQHQQQSGTSTTNCVMPYGYKKVVRAAYETGVTDVAQVLCFKIADGSEGGTNIGPTAGTKCVLVFRAATPIRDVTIGDPHDNGSSSVPANQTTTAGSGTAPLIVLGGFGCGNSSLAGAGVAMSPTETGSVIQDGGANYRYGLYYKLYDSSPANVTVSWTTDRGLQTRACAYLQLDLTSPAPTLSTVGKASIGDSATITVPSGTSAPRAGDLIIYGEVACVINPPTMALPSGFTNIDTASTEVGSVDGGFRLAYKISDGTEGGTTITGRTTAAGNAAYLAIFRSRIGAITAVSVQGALHEVSLLACANQVALASAAASGPVIVMGLWGSDSSPVQGSEMSVCPTEAVVLQSLRFGELKWRIYDKNPVNVTFSGDDASVTGSGTNVMASVYLVLTVHPKRNMIAMFL